MTATQSEAGRDPELDAMIRRVSNWGRWGPEDELGTINLITERKRVEAAGLVRTGRVFSLALPLDLDGPDPGPPRRIKASHMMLQTGADLRSDVQPEGVGGWGYADDMVSMALHSSTHWDSLAHIFYDYKMYNDRDCQLVDANGAHRNDIAKLSGHVVTRGVLADVPRLLGVDHLDLRHRVSADELEQAFDSQRTETRPGDVLLLRTGNMRRARLNGGWDDYVFSDEPGLGIETLPWLHEHGIAAVGVDNWCFEALPGGSSIWLPVHTVGIVHMGMILGENFVLEELAADCAEDGVYEFMFTGLPLPITGAVAGSVHPAAIK
jgi:kynurenine formamidase